jgi:predicted transcriptional regulator
MSNETEATPTPVDTEISLDAFEAQLYGQSETKEPTNSEKAEDTEVIDAQDEDLVDSSDDDDGDADTGDSDESEGETDTDADADVAETKPKKKNSLQERINEVVSKQREAERERDALKAQLEALQTQTAKPVQAEPTPTPEKAEDGRPTSNDLNDDGSEKYPLGDFDPQYIADLTNYNFELRMKAHEAEIEQKKVQQQEEQKLKAVQDAWQEKLGPAQERYPDFHEKGQNLVSTFESIDREYGNFLSATLMGMEYGPDVLYYLANNLDVADKIVSSGPTGAAIALGRLEAKFADAQDEKARAKPRVSKAPTPPPYNKGSTAVIGDIPVDTDSLDDFEKLLYGKKHR